METEIEMGMCETKREERERGHYFALEKERERELHWGLGVGGGEGGRVGCIEGVDCIDARGWAAGRVGLHEERGIENI